MWTLNERDNCVSTLVPFRIASEVILHCRLFESLKKPESIRILPNCLLTRKCTCSKCCRVFVLCSTTRLRPSLNFSEAALMERALQQRYVITCTQDMLQSAHFLQHTLLPSYVTCNFLVVRSPFGKARLSFFLPICNAKSQVWGAVVSVTCCGFSTQQVLVRWYCWRNGPN